MKAVDTACPQCGESKVVLSLEAIAKPIGEFSLAGKQMKFSMRDTPVLECTTRTATTFCGWKLYGRLEDGHAVFDPPTSPEESSLNG